MNLNNIDKNVPALQKTTVQQENQKVQIESERSNETARQMVMTKENEKEKMEVKSTVEKLNEFNDPIHTNLKFVFHEDLEKYYVTVVNPDTDEVIREIPPKKMLDMYVAMTEYMGILVDEKI